MLSRISGAFVVLSVGAVLAGACVAEEADKSSKNGVGTGVVSARPSIFRSGAGSQKFQTAVADGTGSIKLSDANVSADFGGEIDGMERTLARYRSGFEDLSLPEVRQAWPGLDRRRASALKEVFEYFRTSNATPQLGLVCVPPAVIGDSAKVECRESLTYSDAKGKTKVVKPARVLISLRKQSNGWVVETMKGLGKAE